MSAASASSAVRVTDSSAWTQVVFECHVETQFGDSVWVVGSDKAIGNWDLRRGVQMHTGRLIYPTWRSLTAYVQTGREISYKFVIRRADRVTVEWEMGEKNRRVTPPGGRLLLPCKFNVGVGGLQAVLPLVGAWSSQSEGFARVPVPSAACGRSWQQNGRVAHVLFRRMRTDGLEYLFEHRSQACGTWEDGAGQLCLPGGAKQDNDSDSRSTAFRRAIETCLGESVIDFGESMLYEAFKFALVELLTVSPAQGGYYVCDVDELGRGLHDMLPLDWAGSTSGSRSERDVDVSVFPTGCTWVPARTIKSIVDTRLCTYAQTVSKPCPTCLDLAGNAFMKGIPIYGPLKKNLTKFRHKLWI